MPFEERYYREELDYLRQLGKLLAREKPHLARFLAEKEGDADVERLFEAFAFLSAGIRQKIEDEFPELTQSLINMLWPNALRPVPSMTVIEYNPLAAKLSAPLLIGRDELICSGSQSQWSTEPSALLEESPPTRPACHFTLARDIWLQPLFISDVSNNSSLKKGVIDIAFFTEGHVASSALDLSKVTFWLGNEDNYTRQQLYLWFSEQLMDAEFIAGDYRLPLPELWLDSAGFEREEALLPWSKNVYNGFRVLHEFLCYPESFFFFTLRGAPTLPEDFPLKAFTLRLHFAKPLPVDIKLHKHSLRLHCAPAINLFTHPAEPITPDGDTRQYSLQASHRTPEDYDIFQVKSVFSTEEAADNMPIQNSATVELPEFQGFQQQMEYAHERKTVYWHHQTKTSLFHQGQEHFIAFVHADGSVTESALLKDKALTASLICTNRMHPASLYPGDICVAVDKNPAVASFGNITRPTQPLYPVTDVSLQWSLISCMNLNYLSLLDKEALIQILRTFDLPGIHSSQQTLLAAEKLDAIERMETHPADRLFKGIPVRGLSTTLWIDPTPFGCEGEIYMLGSALSHFFSLYASVHSFHYLKVINTKSQESWLWLHPGQHALM